ncbi:MAG: hypothetical protein KJ880_02065 [Candidatus Omnitrophica bacterium]|nr:hypothetical protein [Candidatus Omnitrophota bacterium]MBU1870017.1 hypothetical protein [Candidatus Omnitrophota bacterium]
MRKIAAAFFGIFIIFFAFPVLSSGLRDSYRDIPEPRLLYPVTDEIVLRGEPFLEFKWMNNYSNQIEYYELRLYKGYNMYASGLLLKERIPYPGHSFKVASDFFESGQVYTWSLIQVKTDGLKSDRSFNSFKVIK